MIQEVTDNYETMTKLALLATLKAAGVKTVHVHYSGSNDSGDVDRVVFDPAGSYDELSVEAVNEEGGTRTVHLREALSDYAMQVVENRHAGWEINDGAEGIVTFDVDKREIRIEHNTFYTTSDCSTDSI